VAPPPGLGALTGNPIIDAIRTKLLQNQNSVTILDMEGNLIECSKDQPLSRHIQQRLEDGSGSSNNAEAKKEKDVLFSEIMAADPMELMKDRFGNYVIQRMFDFGSLSQRQLLMDQIKGKILDLSMDQHGCRVI
jgi:mRNA-binding protein PUF3